ncbi:hypothetical protein [Photorhabdus heterorhabditis]|uniref:hypothetical protein n=1 Tax=Photorhabdus heterorhabditis TaxID=880156 RepID=UPI0021D0877B|nr:hypothetical protein [Photorhabdus heterorhabditis]
MADPGQLRLVIIVVAAKRDTLTIMEFAPDGGETGNRLVIIFPYHVIAVQVKPAAARDVDHLTLLVVMEALLVTHIIANMAQAANAVIIELRIMVNLFASITDFPGTCRCVYQVALSVRAKTAVPCRHVRKWHDIP